MTFGLQIRKDRRFLSVGGGLSLPVQLRVTTRVTPTKYLNNYW